MAEPKTGQIVSFWMKKEATLSHRFGHSQIISCLKPWARCSMNFSSCFMLFKPQLVVRISSNVAIITEPDVAFSQACPGAARRAVEVRVVARQRLQMTLPAQPRVECPSSPSLLAYFGILLRRWCGA